MIDKHLPTSSIVLVLLVAGQALGAEEKAAPWQTTLAEGKAQAQRRRMPLLVRFGAESCPWCRKLEAELADAQLQKELARWALVSLTPEVAEKEAGALAVSGIPALRILTPAGRLVASRDGYLPAAALLAWLQKQYDVALAAPAEELIAEGPPSAVAVLRLVGSFAARDPVVREAALRRIASHPSLAAEPVIEAFVKGPLQTRLTALEALQNWRAPTEGLDPWQPASITEARLAKLRQWASRPEVPAGAWTAEQLGEARREIDRMLRGDDSEALATRERLARHGGALLPEVYRQLKEATTDQARARLTMLRYRLVARDALVLNWPGGVERLSSPAPGPRQQALQELTARATIADEPLLRELFSNPDPLVRELSLRALKATSGTQAAGTLLQLLADPEPNVRAAVLKQLAEKPAQALAPKLVEYVKGEADADLIVHAIRALREMKGTAAQEGLKQLLTHASWQVRAEAVEALSKTVERHHGNDNQKQADVYAALMPMLDDADGFVVARAVAGLSGADLVLAIEPLMAAARRHPDLAAEVARVLSQGQKTRAKSVPYLRELYGHTTPAVRAAALQGLGAMADATTGIVSSTTPPGSIEKELRAGLADPSEVVRATAADTIFTLRNQQRPHRDSAFGSAAVPESPSFFTGLLGALGGASKTPPAAPKPPPPAPITPVPAWLDKQSDLLEKQLTQGASAEKMHAALALIALGRAKEALPVLTGVIQKERDLRAPAAGVLPWLAWPERLALFDLMMAGPPEPDEHWNFLHYFAAEPERRTIARVWDLVAAGAASEENASTYLQVLESLYFGSSANSYHNGKLQLPKEASKEATDAAVPRAAKGPEMQRLLALCLLLKAATDKLPDAARAVLADAGAPGSLQRDAFVLLLLSQSKEQRDTAAVKMLSEGKAPLREEALAVLAGELDNFQGLREGKLWLNHQFTHTSYHAGGQPYRAPVPQGLDAAAVRPFLSDKNPKNAARAGYLLALLKEPAGLEPLLRQWRSAGKNAAAPTQLLYRAVATLGDDANVPILEEIYRTYDRDEPSYNINDFYWTIRVLEGPNALRLRKQMRTEIGMDQLR